MFCNYTGTRDCGEGKTSGCRGGEGGGGIGVAQDTPSLFETIGKINLPGSF